MSTLTGLGSITYTGPSPVYVDTSGAMSISAIPTVSSGSPSAYTVEYSSSDSAILVNSSTGVITITGTAVPGTYGLIAYVTDGEGNEFWSNYDFVISSYPATGISSISFVGTVVNDPTMQNLGQTDHSYYTYTNATLRVVASVTPANATDKTVNWSYTNNSGTPISSIDANGNITFSGTEGTVTITAHAQDTSSGNYNSTVKLSVVYADYTFNITNTYTAPRTDSTGKIWIERNLYSTSLSRAGQTKLDFKSTANSYANTKFVAIRNDNSTDITTQFANYSTTGTSSATIYSGQAVTSAIYINPFYGVDISLYARRNGTPYYIKYTIRSDFTLSGLTVSIDSTTSGPEATSDGTYGYFYQGSTVVVKAALQSYQNIGNVVDASANWIAGPEFTVTRLVGTYTVGGVSGLFYESGNYYHKASIYVNSYTATPILSIKATSPDTINSSFNPVIRRSVTGINSITGTTTVQAGSTTTLTSSVQPANAYNQTINWSSSDTSVATVSSSGVVTGVAPGTATITAASAESASYSTTTTVTVTGIPATSISAITFTGTTPVRTTSTGLSVSATVSPANATNKVIIYTSSSTSVATVDASGNITPVSAGTTTITATASDTTNGTLSSTYSLTVYNPVAAISSITRTGFPATVYTDSSGLSISASITTSNVADSGVVYSSSATGVATVNSSTGAVTIVGAGSVTLTATSSENSGVSSTTTFTVYNHVTAISSITRTGFPATVYTDSSGLSISATITTSNVADSSVVYSSSATGVATVNSSTGAVTIVGAGSVTLTATSSENSGVSSTTTFTVYNHVAAMSDITPSWGSATIYTDSSGLSISASITTSNVADSSIVYSSSNTGVATINSSTGVLAIIAAGSTTLRAESVENSSVYKTYSLTVNSPVMAATITSLTIDGLDTTTVTAAAGSVSAYTLTSALPFVDGTTIFYGSAVSDNTTDSITFTVYNDATNAVMTSSAIDISGNSTDIMFEFRAGLTAGLYRIVASINGGSIYTFYLQIIDTTSITSISSIWDTKTIGVAGESKTAYIVTQGEGSWYIDIQTSRSNTANTAALTITATHNGVADAGFSYYPSGTNEYFLYGTDTNYGLTIVDISVSGSNATPYKLYLYWPNPSEVAATGISSVSVSGASSPYTTATTGLSASATVVPGNATNTNVSYKSSDTTVATINSSTGAITAVGVGTTTITAMTEDGAYSSTYSLVISSTVSITNVTSTAQTTTVTVDGQSKTAFVAVAEEGWVVPITITTSDGISSGISANYTATIDGTIYGPTQLILNNSSSTNIYGSQNGIFIINISLDGSVADPYTFYIYYPDATVAVTSVNTPTLSGGSTPVYVGATGLSVTATVAPNNATNQTVSYSSGTTSVATINSSTGALTIVATGSTTITATSADGSYTNTYSLTVYNRPAAISSITPSWGSATVYTTSTGLSISATITTSNVYNSAVVYSSNNTSVATVNSSTGAITIVGAGSATLSAVPSDNTNSVSASTYALTVNAVPSGAITSISDIVFDSTDPMHPNQWNNASVTVQPTSNSDSITWTTSDSSVVKIWDDDNVSTDAVIFAKSTGLATIRAASTLNPSVYKEYSMRVYARTTTMTLISFTGASPFRAGNTGTVSCAVAPYPSAGSPYTSAYQGITWLSSDESVATVDASGVVTGVAQGRVVIYGTTIGIPVRKQSYVLTVAAAATPVTGISALTYTGAVPFRVNAAIGSLTATTIPANATNTNIIYTSDNSGVASISSTTGRIYGYSVGSCTITATTEDGGFSTTYPLTVDVEYVNVQRIADLTLTAPSPVRANSTNVSVSGIAYGANDTTPTNGTLYYYTSTVPMCSINKTTGEITFRGTAGTATVFAVSADDPTIRSNSLSITVLPSYVALTGITDISANNQSPVLVSGQKTLYIRNGGTLQLLAAPVPSNATDNAITWASSNAGITVDASGLATIVTPDTDTVITATNANSTSKTVNLKHIVNVEGVDEISLSIGASTTIELNTTATALSGTYPANATYPGVQWSATPSGIISIDQSGNISTVSVGSATIYARAIDNSGIYQTYNLSVIIPFVEITGMSQITYTGPKYLHVNETGARVSAYVMPTTATNQAVTYTWSPLNLLSIDTSGNITALATGTATIYASATESDGTTVHDSEYVLTIYPETVSITDIGCLEPDVILDVGSTFGFRNPMLPPYATNNQVAWVSSDPDIASVNENGTVTGVARGTTTIHATSTVDSSLTAAYEITVSAVPVSDITPIGTSTTVYTLISTNTMQMTAQVVPSNAGNKTINWTVSDESIATIDASGYITGVAPGAVVVRASADDNPTIYREITVTITPKVVTGISAISSPANVRTVEIGYTLQLSANVLPLNATNQEIRWTSNSGIIEVVNATTGLVRGKVLSNSSVTITATTVDGNYRAFYTLTCIPVKVQDMDPITTSTGDTVMNIGDTLTMTTQVLPLDAVVRNYAWAFDADTSNELQLMQSVASLNASTGEVSALSTGYALFKATSGGQTNTGAYIVKTITIQVGEPVQSLTPITYGSTTILNQGAVVQLGTTTVPSVPTQTGIYWSSSSTAATISQTGVLTVASFTPVKSFTITATPTPYNLDASGNTISVSQTFSIYVAVSGMAAISPSTTTIKRGQTRNLYATISPSNADNKAVVLTVESATNNLGQSVADTSTILVSGINTNGPYIQGVALGTATIKMASAENSSIYRTLTLTIQ